MKTKPRPDGKSRQVGCWFHQQLGEKGPEEGIRPVLTSIDCCDNVRKMGFAAAPKSSLVFTNMRCRQKKSVHWRGAGKPEDAEGELTRARAKRRCAKCGTATMDSCISIRGGG